MTNSGTTDMDMTIEAATRDFIDLLSERVGGRALACSAESTQK